MRNYCGIKLVYTRSIFITDLFRHSLLESNMEIFYVFLKRKKGRFLYVQLLRVFVAMLEKYRQGFDIFYWCPQFDIFNVMMYILFYLFTSFVIGLFLHVPGLCRGHFHGQSVARSQTPGRGEDSPCNKKWMSGFALLYSSG